jgi:hypothetical protein
VFARSGAPTAEQPRIKAPNEKPRDVSRGSFVSAVRRCVLPGDTDHLGGVDDALGDHVDILFVLRVEALVAVLLQELAGNDRAFDARVLDDLADRGFKRVGAQPTHV